nr:MAG TPA: hypothetical protein [Caudoviricetes sp.]
MLYLCAANADVFPVYAGVILLNQNHQLSRACVPRVCGGDPITNSFTINPNRCSPCMRG